MSSAAQIQKAIETSQRIDARAGKIAADVVWEINMGTGGRTDFNAIILDAVVRKLGVKLAEWRQQGVRDG